MTVSKAKNIEYNKAKDLVDNKIADYIQKEGISSDLKKAISDYARLGYREHKYTEIVAESYTVSKNQYAENLVKLVGEKI